MTSILYGRLLESEILDVEAESGEVRGKKEKIESSGKFDLLTYRYGAMM